MQQKNAADKKMLQTLKTEAKTYENKKAVTQNQIFQSQKDNDANSTNSC